MREHRGELSLVFRKNESGNTYLARQYYKLPLQVLRPHYQDDDGTAFVYLLNPGGGVLQHDRLCTDILVEQNARALITTPSGTRFYKMDEGYARVDNDITLEASAVLEYLPEHNVPFAQSRTYQKNIFHLDSQSTLISCDMVTAGRVSMGEIFEYDLYSSVTEIYVDGKLRIYDSCAIDPKSEDIKGIGIMEGYLTNGTIYVHSPSLPSDLPAALREIDHIGDVHFAAGAIDDNLLIVRFLGTDIIALKEAINKTWACLRESLLGKPAVRIRKF